MNVVDIEPITEKKGIAVILSQETPASLSISGADVEGFASDYVFAVGSVLITPSANYIAFSDGEFTAKGEGGGGGGSMYKLIIEETDDGYYIDCNQSEVCEKFAAGETVWCRSTFGQEFPLWYDSEKGYAYGSYTDVFYDPDDTSYMYLVIAMIGLDSSSTSGTTDIAFYSGHTADAEGDSIPITNY